MNRGGLWVLGGALALSLACGTARDESAGEERSDPAAGHDVEPDAPAEGSLTREQVEMYIAVQKRALEIAEERAASEPASSPMESLRARVTSDLRAVEELGHDPEEYRWVKERIAEASPLSLDPGLAGIFGSASREIGRELAGKSGAEDAPPSVSAAHDAARTHNRKLLESYRAELERLAALGSVKPPRH